MAKGGGIGKLSKLKSMIKRWHAASGHSRLPRSTTPVDDDTWRSAEDRDGGDGGDKKVPSGLHPVYVGNSRRRYLISSHLVDHPLFRVLVKRSGCVEEDGGEATTVVGCEVVLFEHLLWMLENGDHQSGSLDELAEFYAC
uniref:Auxin-induced protein X10A n=1 Tax=Anthurium amnicola TaxID=1678845 RepID=A0A1D1XG19_9ARAE